MAAYLIVDVDDMIEHFRKRGIAIDLQELAVGLRGGAALAAGLMSPDRLRAVAAADWQAKKPQRRKTAASLDPQMIFKSAGYDTFQVPQRANLADALIVHYFSYDPEPVDELILATTNRDLIPLVRRIRTTRSARVRMWGSEDVLSGTEFAGDVIFQPLESLLGIQQTKNVSIYIDFENIAISLNEAGYTVNLDELINGFVTQGKAHGQVVKMAAYAPWGQRGSLPPLVDHTGREVADEAPSRLMMANIYPMFNLPGKNSADMLIAQSILTDSSHDDAADTYIIASGDRDFNEVVKTLRSRGKQVILWSVRSSLSRQLESNPNLIIEYVEDFTAMQKHRTFGTTSSAAPVYEEEEPVVVFTPSQWSSVIIQFDRLAQIKGRRQISRKALIEQLQKVHAVVSAARGEDLVAQAIAVGILATGGNGALRLDATHPAVEKTRLVRDRITLRVANTLRLRGWEYVNYGFLLKGLGTDRELDRPGMNYSDEWRSNWIDCLVREEVLARELVPHRHNPDDLVPVIKLRADYQFEPETQMQGDELTAIAEQNWEGVSLSELERQESDTADMVRRIVVSIEQFTSFRGFTWCPLGSLHKRLRSFDRAMSFQRAVEYLIANGAAAVDEYENPMSDFRTKGISIDLGSPICSKVLTERDQFVSALLQLYEKNILISEQSLRSFDQSSHWDMPLWLSIMQTENVLNEVPGRPGQYSLFRTHHTVTLVADAKRTESPGFD